MVLASPFKPLGPGSIPGTPTTLKPLFFCYTQAALYRHRFPGHDITLTTLQPLFTQYFLQFRLNRFGPDFVAFFTWMRRVGHDIFQQEAFLVEKIRADVQKRDVFHAFEQFGEVGVELVDLFTERVIGLISSWKDGENQNLHFRVELLEFPCNYSDLQGCLLRLVTSPADIVRADQEDSAFRSFRHYGQIF